MIEFIIYVTLTGQIRYIGTCEDGYLNEQVLAADESIMQGTADLFTDYILSGVITNRPANPASINKTAFIADGVDSCVISSMLNPSTVSFTVPDKANPISAYVDTDGTLTFTAVEVGIYTISLSSFPYLDKTFTLTAS